MANKRTKRIRYAVAGQGYIAQAAVLPAFENAAKNSELMTLISNDLPSWSSSQAGTESRPIADEGEVARSHYLKLKGGWSNGKV